MGREWTSSAIIAAPPRVGPPPEYPQPGSSPPAPTALNERPISGTIKRREVTLRPPSDRPSSHFWRARVRPAVPHLVWLPPENAPAQAFSPGIRSPQPNRPDGRGDSLRTGGRPLDRTPHRHPRRLAARPARQFPG